MAHDVFIISEAETDNLVEYLAEYREWEKIGLSRDARRSIRLKILAIETELASRQGAAS